MDEKIFADIPHEGGELQEDEEKVETPGESQTPKDEKKSPSQEGDKKDESDKKDSDDNTPGEDDEEKLPFHKHPRFKALVKERNELREQIGELSKKVDEGLASMKKAGETTKVPAWFSRLYGDDPEVYAEYEKADKERREEIKAEIREEMAENAKREREAAAKSDQFVKDSLQELREEGHKFDKDELLNIMIEYQPTDSNGKLDFHKGLDLLEKLKEKNPEKMKERKKLAGATNSAGSSSGEPKDKDVKTWAETRKEGW